MDLIVTAANHEEAFRIGSFECGCYGRTGLGKVARLRCATLLIADLLNNLIVLA